MSTKFHDHMTTIFCILATLCINMNVLYIVLFCDTVRDTDNLHFSADAPRWVFADRRAAMRGYPRGNARIVRADIQC